MSPRWTASAHCSIKVRICCSSSGIARPPWSISCGDRREADNSSGVASAWRSYRGAGGLARFDPAGVGLAHVELQFLIGVHASFRMTTGALDYAGRVEAGVDLRPAHD